MKKTKKDELFVYWLDNQIKHCKQYKRAYLKHRNDKLILTNKLKKTMPGWQNIQNFYDTMVLTHTTRARDYEQWIAALEFAKRAFKESKCIQDRGIGKAKEYLKDFLKKNKPGAFDLNMKMTGVRKKGRMFKE